MLDQYPRSGLKQTLEGPPAVVRVMVAMLSMLLPGMPSHGVLGAAGEVSVITNPSVQAANPIAQNTLAVIYGMRLRSWDDGTPIRVYVLPDDHPVHVRFCKQILGVFPYQLRIAWDRLVYSGTGQAPVQVQDEDEMRAKVANLRSAAITVSSEEEMRAKVADNAGALGYLTRGMVDDSVVVLRVE